MKLSDKFITILSPIAFFIIMSLVVYFKFIFDYRALDLANAYTGFKIDNKFFLREQRIFESGSHNIFLATFEIDSVQQNSMLHDKSIKLYAKDNCLKNDVFVKTSNNCLCNRTNIYQDKLNYVISIIDLNEHKLIIIAFEKLK